MIRECLDPLVKANKCARYVDDVGIGAHTGDDMIDNTIEVLQATDRAGLKFNMPKCRLAQAKVEFLGKLISSEGITPLSAKVDKFLKNLKPPTTVKSLQRYIGFVNFYRNYMPKLGNKLHLLQLMLTTETKKNFKVNSRIETSSKKLTSLSEKQHSSLSDYHYQANSS